MPEATTGTSPTLAADQVTRCGVVGAGTMGAGIAQVAAQAGLEVVLYDVEQRFVERGRQAIATGLDRLVARGRMVQADRDAIVGRLTLATDLARLSDCQFVVEAAPERLDLKLEIFQRLHEVCPPRAILASNTSSLSVTEIARGSGRPDRVVGMHFFNPPPVLKLVEVVRGETSAPETVAATTEMARRFGKTPVVCRDTPGFIVNRVARPFYLEGLGILGEGLADVPTIDTVLRGAGFPMGPFQLMDLIGIDINFAVTTSVFEQRYYEPRFRPHLIQQGLARAGRLGRKTGSGFYDYAADPPTVAVAMEAPRRDPPPGPWERWDERGEVVSGHIVGRVVSALVNEAFATLGDGIASADDIDTAMRLGTNYPRGPLAWGEQVGLPLVLESLEALEDWYRDGRHAPASLLRIRAA